jgi:DNA-binding LacI/PurR family transcriptional regulator
MKVTLKDIALDTGYSISTISRVLSGSDRISSKTKEEVLKSAKELGYKIAGINGLSRSTKQLNIALVATGFHEGEFYSCFFHGLNRAAKKNNIQLFLTGVIDYENEVPKLISNLVSTFYNGIVIFIPELDSFGYEKINEQIPLDFPIVSNSLIENPTFPTITFDSYSGGYLAAKHLHEQGYKTAGVITGPKKRSESRFRKNGFVDYISQQTDIEVVWIFDGDYTFDSGIKAFENFHKTKKKPEAIFATNDTMAHGFLQTAQKHQCKIPEQVALIGYDDLPFNSYLNPSVSSIQTDFHKLGEATIKTLLQTIEGEKPHTSMLSFVPVSISKREST